jgi:hypothetical protein
MSSVQFRPSFLLETRLGEEQLRHCLKRAFCGNPGNSGGEVYHGQFARNHAMISIDESFRHFWSPWLHLEFRSAEGGQQVHARFSPHPSIWTAFMFAWLSLAVLIFFAIMLAVSQHLSGQSAWAWYVIPACAGIGVLLWLVSRIGQNLARQEMQQMKKRLEACLDHPPGS